VTRRHIGSAIAACIRPRAEGGAIIATERGIAVADRDDLKDVRPWGGLIADVRQRCNDGGCDPHGRFYIGTKGYARQSEIAALYRVDPGSASAAPVVWGLTAATGLAWSPDGQTAFLNDAGTGITYTFDYSLEHGLENQRVFMITPPEQGIPKGLAMDAEGGLWVAMDTAGRVNRYDRLGRLTDSVRVPVPGVTACAFGGPNLATMFITTSAGQVSPGGEDRAGAIFTADVGVRGLPTLPFRGEIPRHYT
jgi:sugar lactone lactonase YvrE